MKKKRNLLGKGESLFAKEPWKPRAMSKTQVYTIDQAKERLLPMLRRATSASAVVRDESCYSGKRTMAMRIHPSRISKSAMPDVTFKNFELEILGSRGVEFVPNRSSKSRPPDADRDSLMEESVELFVAGAQRSWEQLEQFAEGLRADDDERSGIEETLADEFLAFEEIRFLTPDEKNGTTSGGNLKEVEILLQQGDDAWGVIDHFARFARLVGFEIDHDRLIDVAGLFFIPVTVTEEQIDAISTYSHVRFIRNAAELRVFNPVTGIRGVINRAIQLPSEDEMSDDFRVAIFDGGIPDGRFDAWVEHFDQTSSDSQTTTTSASAEHGAAVTSAFLFGHMDDGANETPCPPCRVDHYRVIADGDHDPYVVLRRITGVLKSRSYRLVNLSLGPEYAIVDDHIDPWTATLDSFASSGDCFIAVAAGNEGEADQEAGNHRIQPPSDGVNVIGVGALDEPANAFAARASYSSFGPGRSPGIVKPDICVFGGSEKAPLKVVRDFASGTMCSVQGTSFASPLLLRIAAGLRREVDESEISPMGLKALLIHSAERHKAGSMEEVGWGGLSAISANELLSCDDGTVRVIFQGVETGKRMVRTPIPLPDLAELIAGRGLRGTEKAKLQVTVCLASDTNPADSSNYTRSGVEIYYRPKAGSDEASRTLFSPKSVFGRSYEESLRRDSHKWGTVLVGRDSIQLSTWDRPALDFHFLDRERLHDSRRPAKVRYGIVVEVRIREIPDLYELVAQQYRNRLLPIRTRIEKRIRV